jgi:glutaredoxin-related protein
MKDFNMSSNDPDPATREAIRQATWFFHEGRASQFPMCGFFSRAIQVLKACGVNEASHSQCAGDEGIPQRHQDLQQLADHSPVVANKGEFVGGSDIMMEMRTSFQNVGRT